MNFLLRDIKNKRSYYSSFVSFIKPVAIALKVPVNNKLPICFCYIFKFNHFNIAYIPISIILNKFKL